MSEAAWAHWRAAEEKLARDGGVDAAADDLPARQAWILRATAALERGDRGALEELRRTAPGAELEAVADLALSEPQAFDPSRWRAWLKRSGVPNAPLPRLDLLRLACVAHNREEPARPQGLARAARTRPVLDGALMVLSRRFRPYRIEASLLARSPRLASFWAAGIAQHLTNGSVREYVHDHMPEIEPLPLAPWPDLDEPFDRSRRAPSASLDGFLRDPRREPWSIACSRATRVIATRGEPAQRLATIGALLDAIDILVRESAPLAAAPVVPAVTELVENSPEIRRREVLLGQLYLLDLRLAWSSGNVPDELLEPVWRGVQHLPLPERTRCARSILERADGCSLPRRMLSEILALAIQSDADPQREVLPWLLLHGRDVDLHVFQASLRGAPAPGRERALGYLHAFFGSTVEACRLAARMLTRGSLEDATRVAITALAQRMEAPTRGRKERRLLDRALLELAHAVGKGSAPPGAEFFAGLLSAAGSLTDPAQGEELLSILRPRIQECLALAPQAQHADLLSRLQLMTMLGLRDDAQAAFRDFGRWLRRAQPEEAVPGALRLCSGLCPDAETTSGYDRDAEPSAARTEPDDPRPPWLRAITSWLDRQETATVGRHALDLAREDPATADGLARWFLEVSALDSDDTWDTLCEMSVSDEGVSLLEDLLSDPMGGS